MSWQIPQRMPKARQRAQFISRLRRIGLRGRLDTRLLLLVLLMMLVIGGGWLLIGEVSRRALDREALPLATVPDARILTNVREDVADRALLDAAFHEDNLVIAQQGRTLHRFDPQTELWSTELVLTASDSASAEDFVQIGSSGGVLWARGADGSMAMHTADDWSVAIGSSRFVDANGQPVTQEQLTAAAVSVDGRFLAVGTADSGVGLYEISTRTWFPANPGPVNISHLVAWEDIFFIGTPDDGLYRLLPDGSVLPDERIRGTIRDMDLNDDGLYVVERYGCVDEGDGCVRFLRFDTPDHFTVLLDERNNYPELNTQVLHFAQDWGLRTVFAGQNGIYQYDTDTRSWERLFNGRIGRIASLDGSSGFYFEGPGSIGRVLPGQVVQTWDLPSRQALQSLVLWNNQVLALARDGSLFTVTVDGLQTLKSGGGTIIDPALFQRVIAVEDTLLFLHANGLLIHDARLRTYMDVAAADIPAWFLSGSEIIRSGDTVFIVKASNPASVYAVPAADLADTAYVSGRGLFTVQGQTVPTIRRVWAWDNNALGLITADGQLYRLDAATGSFTAMTGEPLPSFIITLVDAVSLSGRTVFASIDRLLTYDLNARNWSVSDPIVNPGERIREIFAHEGRVLLVTDSDRLLDEIGTPIITPLPAQTYNNNLSDAWLVGDTLYTAGSGAVDRYNLNTRLLEHTSQPTGNGSVQLRGILNDLPLTQVGDRAFIGNVEVGPDSGRVLSLSHDDTWIWSVRQLPTHRYLIGHRISDRSDTRCFFRNPSLRAAIVDAVRLRDGIVAVATSRGLQFYLPDARTWIPAPVGTITPDRLYVLGDELLLATENAYQLLSLRSLTFPDSCSDAPASITSLARDSVRGLAVDPVNMRFAWLTRTGMVREWSAGNTREVLGPAEIAPLQTALRRFYDRSMDAYLLFTAERSIWRYDLTLRTWRQITLNLPPSVILQDVIAEFDEALVTVLAQDTDGRIYSGTFSAVPAAIVPIQLIMQLDSAPSVTVFPAPNTGVVNIDEMRIEAQSDGISITLNGADALLPGGFIWDQVRTGIAYGDGNLLLQSAAGVHPITSFGEFDTGASGTLYGLAEGIYARDEVSGNWQQRINGTWNSAADPGLNRELFSDSAWTWTVQNGRVNIALTGESFNFALTIEGLNSDDLQAAASYNGQLIVTTSAFTEIAAPDLFGAYGASRLPAEAADRYEVLHFADDSLRLFAYRGRQIREWDGNRFNLAVFDPLLSRPLVATDRLRLTLDSGRVIPELRVDDVQTGASTWVSFTFDNGRWPFDVVTSAASFDNRLYIGTRAGLEIHSTARYALGDADQLLDFRGNPQGALAGVERVGKPDTAPNTLMVRGTSVCLERRAGLNFTPCVDPTWLDSRLRVDDGFWWWTLGNTLIGRYRDTASTPGPRTIDLQTGYLPHDRINDAVFCDGETILLWEDGTISHQSGNSLSLTGNIALHFVSGVNELRCVESNHSAFPAGAYALGTTSLRYDGVSWIQIDPSTAQMLRDDRQPDYARARLRYLDDIFQRQTLAGNWEDLQWMYDPLSATWRLELDAWQYALPINGQLWAATSAGWLPFTIDASGQAAVDPDSLHVVDDAALAGCTVTDALADADQLTLRCDADSARVYTGILSSSVDGGVFTTQSQDPFASAVLIDNDLWQWTVEGRNAGAFGILAGRWKDRSIDLANGHFAWDTLTSVAFFSEGLMDLTTEGAGWLTLPRGAYALQDVVLPNAAQADILTALHIAPDDILCLRLNTGDYLRFNVERQFLDQSADCAEWLAEDDLWIYTRTEEELRIPDQGATTTRLMEDGRFTDDIALGIPVFDPQDESYWLATEAGVIQWDHNLAAQAISGGDFAGLPPGAVPSALLVSNSQLLYPAGDGLYDLQSQQQVQPLDLSGLEEGRFTTLNQDGDLVQGLWERDIQRGFSRFDLVRGLREDNSLTLDVLEFPAYVENRQTWGDPDPTLVLRFEENRVETQFNGRTQIYALPSGFSWIRVLQDSERVYLVGVDDVLWLSLNTVLYDLGG